MPEPKVCVSLDGTTVKSMADEAARANLAGADFVEVRFDRLYLKKPEPTEIEGEDGEIKRVMPDESEWPAKDVTEVDVESSIQSLKESIPLPVIFTARPVSEGGFFPGTEEERLSLIHI